MRDFVGYITLLIFVGSALAQTFQNNMNLLLDRSVFARGARPAQLVPGVDYDPVLISVAASLTSRSPKRSDARWLDVRVHASRSSACTGPIKFHVRRSRRPNRPTFVIFPGSFATWKNGSFVNQTSKALDDAFDDPNQIVLPGYLTKEFLSGACDHLPWNERELGADLFERLGRAFPDLLDGGDSGVVGFSGGATLAMHLLANDARRSVGTRRFGRGGLAFSPVLHAATVFSRLDDRFERRTMDARFTLSSLDLANLFSFATVLGLGAGDGIGRVFTRDPAQFYARFYNEFRADLEDAREAVGWARAGSYRQTFVVDGFGAGSDRPGLDEQYNQVTDLGPILKEIDRSLLIVYAGDDPVSSDIDGKGDPVANVLREAGSNPSIAVFHPAHGAHVGSLLDPIFGELIQTVLKPPTTP